MFQHSGWDRPGDSQGIMQCTRCDWLGSMIWQPAVGVPCPVVPRFTVARRNQKSKTDTLIDTEKVIVQAHLTTYSQKNGLRCVATFIATDKL